MQVGLSPCKVILTVLSAQCAAKCFLLSNMGNTAVSSHASSKKHLAALKLQSIRSQSGLLSFFTAATNVSAGCSGDRTCAPEEPAATTTSVKTLMSGFLLKSAVTKAEIIWCLNSIAIHGSLCSTAVSASVFPFMFPACEVAAKLWLGKDKVGYTVCHGIVPYFRNKVLSSLASVHFVVVLFGKSLNQVTRKQQMDVLVRYWDTTSGTVKMQYLTSCFLGHTCAKDLASAFRERPQKCILHKKS
uniref:Putative transposase-like protein n=1 Tax=Ixodes ricinus TaxID=34613 RepID=A0A147BBZ3_IXORI